LTESELALAEAKVTELGQLFTKAKEEQVDLIKVNQNEVKKEREVRLSSNRKS